MRKLFILAAIIFKAGISTGQTTSIYSFKIDSLAENKIIDFSAFKGKMILLVNAASGDTAKYQYALLKHLNSRYKDKLAIIVIPTNSFNTENKNEAAMSAFYSQEAGNRFPVAKKLSVKGSDIHPLYKWLTQKNVNGVMDSQVGRPYQKYLINKTGKLIGVFSARVSLFEPSLIQAITNN